MDVQKYLQTKRLFQEQQFKYRELCSVCIQPEFGCYCRHIQKFDSKIHFVILIHPIEVKRRIATGRMSHLTLENSDLIAGQDYTNNQKVNAILADPTHHSVMLYPGPTSKNISPLTNDERKELFPLDKKLTIFVIDGTWATARKMVRQSENLKVIPKICFTPEKPSTFRVRKQPRKECFSTIEAVHHTIELLGPSQGFNTENRGHDKLLNVFDSMVELQLKFVDLNRMNPRKPTYRRDSKKSA